MGKSFTYSTYKKNFDSVTAVMEHMLALDEELQNTDLTNLRFFNKTYFIITKNVYKEIGKDYFASDKTMGVLDIQFARYYFDALKEYITGKDTTPSWEETFIFCKNNKSIPLIYLAQGVNAHVNNDLAFALFDSIQNQNFKNDFAKVNKILYESLDEVIDTLHVTSLYKPFMNLLIKYWRNNAWNNYERLLNKNKTKKDIEIKAESIAKDLSRIYSKKDFYKLYKII